MFEIWEHHKTGERYLVVVRDGEVNVAAGPLPRYADPRRVLETQSEQHHNTAALLDIRRAPEAYHRLYTRDHRRRVTAVEE